jgi:glyoxylate/hydroxypyruvate reductase A
MGAILISVNGPQAATWHSLLRNHATGREVIAAADVAGRESEISFACVWLPPAGLLARLPNLKAIINLGAGADRLLGDPTLPQVPIARVAHADLTTRVTEYVVLHVLMHHRRHRLYDGQQRQRLWRAHDQPAATEVNVGVMGLGVIGSNVAVTLARLGFRVGGWSRTPSLLPGIETFHGAAGLDAFLARTEILVCLLPQTPQTEGLLSTKLFCKLKRDGAAGGAFLINAGRGSLQVDADIIAAIKNETLMGATLDVFPQEPLPEQSPLWTHPRITITPHNAGDISPRLFAPVIVEQIERFERGLPMDHLVDRDRGY